MKSSLSVDRVFADWLARRSLMSDASNSTACFSIAIQSPCLVCQPRVAFKLAAYLDEFDGELSVSGWLPINDHRLEQLQANSDFHQMLRHEHADQESSAVSYLARQGGVIMELPQCFEEIADNDHVFQVSMSCSEPEEKRHHLWLNAKRIPEETLIPMIASTFFDWAHHGGDISPEISKNF